LDTPKPCLALKRRELLGFDHDLPVDTAGLIVGCSQSS
jgi:hypothetical protein